MESTFIELRCKEIVNILDGRRLGHIIDMVFDLGSARVLGFIKKKKKTGWNIFKNSNQLFIPYGCIVRIGEDTILVELPAQGVPTNPYVLAQNNDKNK